MCFSVSLGTSAQMGQQIVFQTASFFVTNCVQFHSICWKFTSCSSFVRRFQRIFFGKNLHLLFWGELWLELSLSLPRMVFIWLSWKVSLNLVFKKISSLTSKFSISSSVKVSVHLSLKATIILSSVYLQSEFFGQSFCWCGFFYFGIVRRAVKSLIGFWRFSSIFNVFICGDFRLSRCQKFWYVPSGLAHKLQGNSARQEFVLFVLSWQWILFWELWFSDYPPVAICRSKNRWRWLDVYRSHSCLSLNIC